MEEAKGNHLAAAAARQEAVQNEKKKIFFNCLLLPLQKS